MIYEFPLLENGGEGWRLQYGDKANGLPSFPATLPVLLNMSLRRRWFIQVEIPENVLVGLNS